MSCCRFLNTYMAPNNYLGGTPLLNWARLHVNSPQRYRQSTFSPSSPSLSPSSEQTPAIDLNTVSNSQTPSKKPMILISTLFRFGQSRRLRTAAPTSSPGDKRCGWMETIRCLTDSLGVGVVPATIGTVIEGLKSRNARRSSWLT